MKGSGLKLLALLIAILLSLFVHSESNVSSTKLFVPVEVKDLPTDKIVVWQLRRQVEIEIRGPAFLVNRVSSSPPVLRVRIPADTGSRYVKTFDRSDINIPPPLQVVSIEPQKIDFNIESRLSKEVPVKIIRIGALPEGFRLEGIEAKPETVVVSGPETEIKEIQKIESYPIDLGEVSGNTTQQLNLRVPGKLSELSPSSVTVALSVSSLSTKRKFGALPIEVRAAPGLTYVVSPLSVDIELTGGKESIDKLKSSEVIPYVRLLSEVKGPTEVQVRVDPPAGTSIISIEPKTVTVSPGAAKSGAKSTKK